MPLPNNVEQDAGYDGANRLVSLSAQNTANHTLLNNLYQYGYDPLGLTTAITTTVQGSPSSQSLTHNAAGRLTAVTGTAPTGSWSYDGRGNLITVPNLCLEHTGPGPDHFSRLIEDPATGKVAPEIATDHTFFVGPDGVLVHNGDCPGFNPPRGGLRKFSSGHSGALKMAGYHVLEEKGTGSVAIFDLCYDKDGWIYQLLKGGKGEPEPLGFNIKDIMGRR